MRCFRSGLARSTRQRETHPRRHARQCYVFETIAAMFINIILGDRLPVNNF